MDALPRIRRALDRSRLAVCLCALIVAYALKWHYSTATAGGLKWILAPTTMLVEIASGASFEFETSTGYLCKEQYFLIVPSCAGVNFFITSFLMLCVGRVIRAESIRSRWLCLPSAAGIAYGVTLMANALRISIAMELRRQQFAVPWLDASEFHRAQGIAVYFGGMMIVFALVEPKVWRSVRWMCVPLLMYYAAAIVVPAANSAYQQNTEFWRHAAFALLVPLCMVVLALSVRVGFRAVRKTVNCRFRSSHRNFF